jgi:hypothetical protein
MSRRLAPLAGRHVFGGVGGDVALNLAQSYEQRFVAARAIRMREVQNALPTAGIGRQRCHGARGQLASLR